MKAKKPWKPGDAFGPLPKTKAEWREWMHQREAKGAYEWPRMIDTSDLPPMAFADKTPEQMAGLRAAYAKVFPDSKPGVPNPDSVPVTPRSAAEYAVYLLGMACATRETKEDRKRGARYAASVTEWENAPLPRRLHAAEAKVAEVRLCLQSCLSYEPEYKRRDGGEADHKRLVTEWKARVVDAEAKVAELKALKAEPKP